MKLSDLSYWKNLRTSIIAVFLISVLMAPMVSSDITAVGTYFEVSPKENFVAGIGQEFTIDINIVDAPDNDTKAWELTLEWSNSVLEITDTGEGTFLSSKGTTSDLVHWDLSLAQAAGEIGISCALLGEPVDLAGGSGWLCNVTFEVLSCETCALNLKDTGLVDRAGERTDYPNNDGFFACAEVHDIAITDVTPNATSVQQDDVIEIDVTVHNGGNYTESGSVTVAAYPEDSRSPVVSIDTSKPFTDLAEGNDVVLTFTWDTSGAAGEVYVLNATATVTGGDDDPHDNTYIGPKVRVISEDDVKITDVTVLTPEVSKGAPIANITVTVRNEGKNGAAIDVTLTANPGAIAAGTQSINLAGYDAETTLTFNWNTTLVPPTKASLWAPASPSNSITYTITATATITNATEATKNLNDNTLVDGTVTVAVYDAAVTGVKILATCNPSGFHPVVRATANITNLGTEDIKVKVVLLAATNPADPGTYLVCGLIPYIAASPSETVTVSSFSPYGGWNTKLLDLYGAAPPTPGSNYYVMVKVYYIIGYTDDYPGNDANMDGPWTLPTVNHDVKVTDVTLLTPKVAKGDIAKINVTVYNEVFGVSPETVTVNIYGNDTLKNSTTVILPPAEMITFMNATNFPNTNITVIESCGWYMYNLTLGGSPMGNVLFPANDTWWTIRWPSFLYDEVYTTTFHIDQGWWVNPYPVGPYTFHVDSVMKAGKEASIPGVTTSTPKGLPVVIAWKLSCKTVTVPWWTVGEALGEYTIKANATVVAGDDDPCDNARIDGKIKLVDHDVGVSIESVTRYMYLPVNVPVTVKNWGNYKENITVKVYIDYGNTTTKTITYDITNLEAGMSNTTDIFVRTAPDKCGFTWMALITVNATITTLGVTDDDLSDNVLTESYVAFIEYIGDVDDSAYTDWFDMSMVGLAYESGPGAPNWNPDCDFDGSNYVDWFDMSMLGLYYESGW